MTKTAEFGTGMSTEIGRADAKSSPLFADFVVVFSFFIAFGFPGNFSKFLGGSSELALGYVAFALQIGAMLLSSGDTLWEIRPINLKRKFTPIYLCLAVFFIVSMISTINFKEQLISCLRFSVTGLFGLWIADNYSVNDVLGLLYRAQWLFVAATLAFLVLAPGNSFNYMNGELSFTGLFAVKNSCALELGCGMLCQFCMIYCGGRRKASMPFIALFVIQFVLMVMCRATGAMFCCFVPMVYLFFKRRSVKQGRRLPIGLIFTVASTVFLFTALTVLPFFAPLLEKLGKDATLTGRTVMWEQIISMMLSTRTLTGYGFSMFWRNDGAVRALHAMFKKNSWYSTMTFGSHNTVLELWLDVGLIGLVSYFLMILLSFRNVRNMQEKPYIFCFAYMTSFMLKGLTERSYTTSNYQTIFIFMLAGFGCACAARKTPSRHEKKRRKGNEDNSQKNGKGGEKN